MQNMDTIKCNGYNLKSIDNNSSLTDARVTADGKVFLYNVLEKNSGASTVMVSKTFYTTEKFKKEHLALHNVCNHEIFN